MLELGHSAFTDAVPAEAEAPRRRVRAVFRLALALSIAAGDAALATAWTAGSISATGMCGLHVAGSCLLIGGPAVALRKFSAATMSDILGVVLLGPLGAMGLLLQWPGGKGRRQGRSVDGSRSDVDQNGHAGRAELLFAAIRQHRRVPGALVGARSFLATFDGTDRAAQNAALRTISRHYRPDMLPALMRALNSDTPAVRVQAAAVYGKLRGTYGTRARALLSSGTAVADGAEATTRALACRETAASGFVDSATAEALGMLASALDTRVKVVQRSSQRPAIVEQIVSGSDAQPAAARHPLARPPRLKSHSCGGIV